MELDGAELEHPLNGPSRTVLRWAKALDAGDDYAWRALDRDLRLWLIQTWITVNPGVMSDPSVAGQGRDEFADLLARKRPEHPLFVHARRVSLRTLANALDGFLGDELTTGSRTRVVAPDIEAVRLFKASAMPKVNGVRAFMPGAYVPVNVVFARMARGRWRIAGVGPQLPVPGWPPSVRPISNEEID